MTIDINTKELWTTEEAAAYTGYSVQAIQDLCKTGVLSHYKPANRIFIERTAVLSWMRQGKRDSSEDLDNKARLHIKARKAS